MQLIISLSLNNLHIDFNFVFVIKSSKDFQQQIIKGALYATSTKQLIKQ